jgi:hypothetical protein
LTKTFRHADAAAAEAKSAKQEREPMKTSGWLNAQESSL